MASRPALLPRSPPSSPSLSPSLSHLSRHGCPLSYSCSLSRSPSYLPCPPRGSHCQLSPLQTPPRVLPARATSSLSARRHLSPSTIPRRVQSRPSLFFRVLKAQGSEAVVSAPPSGTESGKGSEDEALKERLATSFEELRQKQLKAMDEEELMESKIQSQVESELIQESQWNGAILKAQGKLMGSQWDPLPGAPITFAEFWDLTQRKQVQYMEYAEHGKYVAAILPHSAEELGLEVKADGPLDDPEVQELNKIVYQRHPVLQMPADVQTELWEQLRGTVIDVRFADPLSWWGQTAPTVHVFTIWVLRFIAAVAFFRVVDSILRPIYRPTKLSERPVLKRKSLAASMSMELGLMGQSRARFISAEETTGVTFDDFAGQDYVKRELQEVVKILKDSKEFGEMGVYCPKGVMLFGPPGTGKTLLARAIAGEAGVPFFSVSGSEFVEMFVGVAAARVRDLFARARSFAPSIIFIDEIDAIGSKRGAAEAGGGNIEREQGLVQILTELDGFQTNQAKVLVIGATNRLDMLDPALLRKGRFDRALAVARPTREGRLAILQVHARNKLFASDEEKERLLTEISEITYDYSGAELMNVLNEASILAVRKDKDFIEKEELMEAIQRQEGEFKTGEEDEFDVSGEARLRVAYRESAVSVLHCAFPDPKRPFTTTNSVDLEPRPNLQFATPRHRIFSRKAEMVDSIVRTCAPSVVEEMVFGRPNMAWNTGASVSEAAQLAEYLILQTGLTALGPVHYHTEQDLVSHLRPKVVALRDEYMRYALHKCRSVLEEYRSAVETLAERLMEKEQIFADEIWDVFRSAPRIPQPPVREVDEYWALLYSGRWGIHGVSLPGRVTFSPGNCGYATFGAPRPRHVQLISDDTWQALDEKAAELTQEWAQTEQEIKEDKFGEVLQLSQML